LVTELRRLDPELAEQIDLRNARRVIRAIETAGQPRRQTAHIDPSTLLIGLKPHSEVVNKNIVQRTQQMAETGLVAEVAGLAERYGAGLEALNTVGYREVLPHVRGEISREQMIDDINLHTRQLVKRQLTWFRRNPEIKWFDSAEQALSGMTLAPGRI
jgi:tRNA dimethylallyltransferase